MSFCREDKQVKEVKDKLAFRQIKRRLLEAPKGLEKDDFNGKPSQIDSEPQRGPSTQRQEI